MRRMMRPRLPRDLDARPTRGLAEEDIGQSATPGPKVERAQLPLLVDRNIDSETGRAHGRFPTTLVGELALAIPTATITAFVVFWAVTTAWAPSRLAADGDSGPSPAAVARG